MSRQYHVLGIIVLVLLVTSTPVNADSTSPTISWKKLLDTPSINPYGKGVFGTSISPDGRYIVYGDNDTGDLVMLDWQTSRVVWQAEDGLYYGVKSRWSPDGKYIATWADVRNTKGKDEGIQIFDTTNGQHLSLAENAFSIAENVLRRVPCSDCQTTPISYTDVAWSADSNQLAALAYGHILVYDFTTHSIPTIVDLSLGNEIMSYFDWSPDQSKFAAFHFKKDRVKNKVVIPIEIVMGFWNKSGDWLYQFEKPDSDVTSGNDCVPKDLLLTPYPIGGPVTWAPDNQTITVSIIADNQITVCSLQSNNKLLVRSIFPGLALQFHWSSDQKWLFSMLSDCTVIISDVDNNYTHYTQPFEAETCEFYSGGWSSDSHYVVTGNSLGLWVGTVEFPK